MKKVRIISLFLAMAMLLSACGGGKTSETTSSGTNRNAVFKEIELPNGKIARVNNEINLVPHGNIMIEEII